jgi:hypothetical protein
MRRRGADKTIAAQNRDNDNEMQVARDISDDKSCVMVAQPAARVSVQLTPRALWPALKKFASARSI